MQTQFSNYTQYAWCYMYNTIVRQKNGIFKIKKSKFCELRSNAKR